MIGVFTVAAHAFAMPAATRSARICRFSGEPSFHLPAPMLPPAPSKWMWGHLRGLLTRIASDARKVRVGKPGPVVALGVRGIVSQGHDRHGDRPRS